MELLDLAVIAIPASFFFLMTADFISGLVALFNSQSLNVEDAKYLLQIIDAVPHLEPCVELCIEDGSDEVLPDPWMLPSDEVEAIAHIATVVTTSAPHLYLLPPARPQIITLPPADEEALATIMPIPATPKRGRPKKEVAPAPAAVAPKRRGRPGKTA